MLFVDGSGTGFCAGLDPARFAQDNHAVEFLNAQRLLAETCKPAIAAVKGTAAATWRVAREEALKAQAGSWQTPSPQMSTACAYPC